MGKLIYSLALAFTIVMLLGSCKSKSEKETTDVQTATEESEQSKQVVQDEAITDVTIADETATEEPIVAKSNLGSFEGLVGKWTVDAATAGIKMDLGFAADGTFTQLMGVVKNGGTWEVLDEERIKVITPHTSGQIWKVTDLTKEGVNICWNPDKPKPKTIPMKRLN